MLGQRLRIAITTLLAVAIPSLLFGQSLRMEWAHVIDSGRVDQCTGIEASPGGDVYVVGAAGAYPDSTSLLLCHYLADGSHQWTVFAGSQVSRYHGPLLAVSPDGTAVVSAHDSDSSTILLARYDLGGVPMWSEELPGIGNRPVSLLLQDDRIHLVSNYEADWFLPEISILTLAGQLVCSRLQFPFLVHKGEDAVHVDGRTYAIGHGDWYTYDRAISMLRFAEDCGTPPGNAVDWHSRISLGGVGHGSAVISLLDSASQTLIGYVGYLEGTRGDTDIWVGIYQSRGMELHHANSFDLAEGDDEVVAAAGLETNGVLTGRGQNSSGDSDVLIGGFGWFPGDEWWMTYDGPESGDDKGVDVEFLPSGEIVVLAEVEGPDGPHQALLLYDGSGQFLDDFLEPFIQHPVALAVTSSGKIYTAGYNDEAAQGAPGDIIINKYFVGPGVGVPAQNPESRRLSIGTVEANPVSGPVRIAYELPAPLDIKVRVYAATGRILKTLVSGPQSAGDHELIWDGRSDSGEEVSSGVYFVRFDVGNRVERRRVVLVR